MKRPSILSRFHYFAIPLAVESSTRMTRNEIVGKKKPIRQHKKTGEVQAKFPDIVLKGKKPKEVLVWKTLTPEAGEQCIQQIRHLTDQRNTGLAAAEKMIRLRRKDYVAA